MHAIYEMSTGIDQIDHSSHEAMTKAEQALDKALAGDSEIGKIKSQMDAMQDMMNKLKAIMQSMQARSNEIGEINDVISEISTHTNLLSLNAPLKRREPVNMGAVFRLLQQRFGSCRTKRMNRLNASQSLLAIFN